MNKSHVSDGNVGFLCIQGFVGRGYNPAEQVGCLCGKKHREV